MKTYSVTSSFTVLLVLLTKTAEGKTCVQQTIKYSVFPVSTADNLPLDISGEFDSTQQHDNNSFSIAGVTLPDVPCSPDTTCARFDDPHLICVNGQCTCSPPYCWVYHMESSGWTSKNVFSCGPCGQLGSWCNASYTCDIPGECLNDGYCHCPEGEHYANICVVVDQSWAYKFTLFGFGIIFLVGIFIMCCYFYKNRPWDQPGPWCCGLCGKSGGSRSRHGSCEKTPAFTVQNLYFSLVSDFDTDSLQGATNTAESSTSRQHQEHSITHRRRERTDRSSVISVETVTTSISGSSTPSRQHRAPTASDSSSEGARSLSTDSLPTLDTNVDANVETSNTPKILNNDCPNISSSSSGSCTHERCQLCLPMGLSTRPNKDFSRSSPGDPSIISDARKSLVPVNQQQTFAQNFEEGTKNLDIECTQL